MLRSPHFVRNGVLYLILRIREDLLPGTVFPPAAVVIETLFERGFYPNNGCCHEHKIHYHRKSAYCREHIMPRSIYGKDCRRRNDDEHRSASKPKPAEKIIGKLPGILILHRAAGTISVTAVYLLWFMLIQQNAEDKTEDGDQLRREKAFGKCHKYHPKPDYGLSLSGLLKRNIASFIVRPSRSMVSLSTPRPKPPWGGQPYLKNSR